VKTLNTQQVSLVFQASEIVSHSLLRSTAALLAGHAYVPSLQVHSGNLERQ
jgi:hypothetical protein